MTYLEFGVAGGKSFRWWVDHCTHPDARFFGFDTFTGLPEQWGGKKQGHFSTEGKVPNLDDPRVAFVQGMFQETLPGFLHDNKELLMNKKVIHLDADLYASTLYVLLQLQPYLQKGDILIFDEIFSLSNAHTEFRAFLDYRAIAPFECRYLYKTMRELSMVVE